MATSVASAPTYMSGAQLLAMSPAQRQQYIASLPASQQQAAQAAYQQALMSMNRDYMKKTVRKKAVCPPASGSGLTQTYANQAMLTFSAPSANNAFLEGFYVILDMFVDFATGTSAVYGATASRELALITEIDVLYNGTQGRIKPFMLKPYRQISGYLQQAWPGGVLLGGHNTETDTYLTQGSLPVSGTNQHVRIEYYVPLNALHPQDVRGLLPIDANSTTAQIAIQCANAFVGNDPILNVWYPVSGSGHAVTIHAATTPTVQVIAAYRDGTTMSSTSSLPVNLAGLGTTQYQYDVPLTGVTSGVIYRQKVTLLEQHYYAILVVVDGQQANAYSTETNIVYLDLATDSTGSNKFWSYGLGTNMSVQEWFNDLRDMLGQDLDEGIVPIAMAPIYMEADPSNLNGSAVMNCSPSQGGWSDIHYGVQFNSLASTLTGVTPRVEAHLIYVNPQGLVATA